MHICLGLVAAVTRSPAQKPAHKGLKPEWPKTSHSGSRPLMLRLLTAPAHAQQIKRPATKPFCHRPFDLLLVAPLQCVDCSTSNWRRAFATSSDR
ncbi:hypothetical protein DB330_09060 [Lacticaseibacillus casei]|nr:hypothetical protein [Lacticaseibacillus casei]PTU93692.1 hypothetical protein DB330_09060 [Lacticaseibacillus casei]PTU94579.1 hypothetical protein DB326_09190 [Lacticaseibacillus casei]RXS56772.1 hypothetical protein ETB94_09150 [Lacticaseibacillus casei]TLF32624.1 hypothetical protein FEI10_09115 [Lacticaseibacillus casei]